MNDRAVVRVSRDKSVPRDHQAASVARPPDRPDAGGRAAPKRHVLVFDDNDAILKLVQEILADEGYAVTVAATPDEARGALGGQHVDLALVDVAGYGSELVRDLRKHDPALPIFLFTALGIREANTALRSLPYEGIGLILKPFDTDDLLATIRQALSTAEASRREPRG